MCDSGKRSTCVYRLRNKAGEYHTVGTVPKSKTCNVCVCYVYIWKMSTKNELIKKKIVERGKIDTLDTEIQPIGECTSIKKLIIIIKKIN